MRFAMGILLQVTGLAIVGFFLLFAASKAQGFVAFLGRALAIWVYFIAASLVAAAVMAYMHMGPLYGPAANRYAPSRYYWAPQQNPPMQRPVPPNRSRPRT